VAPPQCDRRAGRALTTSRPAPRTDDQRACAAR